MADYKSLVRYDFYNNKIVFPGKVASSILADFSSAIGLWLNRRPTEELILDFSKVVKAYPNGMLAIIATICSLKSKGYVINIELPFQWNTNRLFLSTNWAHLLDPYYLQSESAHDRHLVARQFTDYKDIPGITNDVMDVVMRSMPIPADIIPALEWSVNEVCDNVINHSESEVGGFVEVVTYPTQELISFTVADAGRGILSSLKEAIPTLRTDSQAIGEAIKAGVTRNKEAGQGNGLAGTLRIATMTGGSMDIVSGAGRFYSSITNSNTIKWKKNQSLSGTSVSGHIKMNKSFQIGEALNFKGTGPYVPLSIVDLKYEMPDSDCLSIKMKEETTGFGTRHAGRQMRFKLLNLINSKPNHPVYVDWEGVPVISSSFADELMGKLFLELGPLRFGALIRQRNMEPLVYQLLDKAIMQRLHQEKDS
ncbi:MAG: DUF4325 domain-containing protein [Bacteroidetes bacterium]|nr:DUF4325 domain-containing protein [Bacteroidota bacterium]